MTEGYMFVPVITFAGDEGLHNCPGNKICG